MFNNKLSETLQGLKNVNKNIFVAGDFNIDLLKIDNHTVAQNFFEIFASFNLLPAIYKPTRITDCTATLIDNIFTNCLSNCVHSSIIFSDISDHLPVAIVVDLKVRNPKGPKFIYKRHFTVGATDQFNIALNGVNWEDVIKYCVSNDPEEAYNNFILIYTRLYDKYFPVRKIRCSSKNYPKQPWITKGLIKSCKKKSTLYKKYLCEPTVGNKYIFTVYRNKLKSLLRRAEKDYYTNKIVSCQYNLSSTWKIIRSLLNKSKAEPIPNTFISNGSTVVGNENVANAFNNYFINISSKLASNIPQSNKDFKSYFLRTFSNSFGLYYTDQSELLSICNNLQVKNSTGHDNVSSTIVKKTMLNIVEPLTHIFNSSFRAGVVPNSLKIAKVVPIYKSGPKDQLSNYRPISVLPFFSKLLEKVVNNRLVDYLNKWSILTQNQYGFRSNHSTCMAVIEMCDKITQALDENRYAVGVFIDLSKAFDTVNDSILLKKTRTIWN